MSEHGGRSFISKTSIGPAASVVSATALAQTVNFDSDAAFKPTKADSVTSFDDFSFAAKK